MCIKVTKYHHIGHLKRLEKLDGVYNNLKLKI